MIFFSQVQTQRDIQGVSC